MGYYLFQGAYTSPALASLVRNPEDRTQVVRAAIEKLGGKMVGSWFCFGEYDVVLICELPNNISAAALAASIAAGGALKSSKTTALFGPEETLEILKTARKTGYRPPK